MYDLPMEFLCSQKVQCGARKFPAAKNAMGNTDWLSCSLVIIKLKCKQIIQTSHEKPDFGDESQ